MVLREAKLVIKKQKSNIFFTTIKPITEKKEGRLAALRCQPRYFFSRLAVGLFMPS